MLLWVFQQKDQIALSHSCFMWHRVIGINQYLYWKSKVFSARIAHQTLKKNNLDFWIDIWSFSCAYSCSKMQLTKVYLPTLLHDVFVFLVWFLCCHIFLLSKWLLHGPRKSKNCKLAARWAHGRVTSIHKSRHPPKNDKQMANYAQCYDYFCHYIDSLGK